MDYSNILAERRIKKAERKQENELNQQLREEKQKQEERENANVFERIGTTIADVFTEIGGGLAKSFEGIVDAGAMIAGGIGSLFGADNQWAKDFVSRDYTQELWYSWEDDFTNNSYLNDKAPVVKDIARGVGQMLPTIALAPTGLGWLGVAGTVVGAGGTGAEEALNEGASYGEALAYGVMQSGIEFAVEGVTAGLGKGITSLGKGIGKTVARSTGKVMLEEAGSEFVEEGLSALLNPLTKSVYQGSEALDAYKDMTFYLDAGQQALVGGIVGAIAGGSSSAIVSRRVGGSAQSSIQQSIAEMQTLEIREANLWKNNRLTTDRQNDIETQRQAELNNISTQLRSMTDSERAQTIKKFNLSEYFSNDGSIIDTNANTDTDLTNDTNTARKPLISDNKEAYSPSLRNKTLLYAPTQNALSQSAKEAKNFITSLNSQAKIVITDNMPSNVNAFYDTNSKVLYFSNDSTTQEIAGHELTHSLEGTKEYESLKNYILENTENLDARIAEKIEQYKNVNTEAKSGENGQFVARYEAETEIVAEEMGKYLSDADTVQRIVNQSKSRAYRIWQWIKDAVARLTKRGQDGEYYRFIRKVENLYTKAIQNSIGGVGLKDVRYAIDEFERRARQEIDGETIANSEEMSYNEGRYKYVSRDAKEITEREYYHHYWVTANNILSRQEHAILAKEISTRENLKKLPKTPDGLYMIATGENGIYNKIVFTDATNEAYSIDRVIEINIHNETELSLTREDIYAFESNGIQTKNSELFKIYTPDDVSYLIWSKEFTRSTELSQDYNGSKKRTRDNRKTNNNARYSLKSTIEEDVVKAYGKTYSWRETGYILQDGTKLDLSGKNNGAPGGYRSVDHREIFDIYEDSDVSGTDAMIEFISRGNIRVIPEYPGINLQIEPTETQYQQIRSLIENLGWKEKSFIVDFDNANGETVANLSYENTISANKIIDDIKYYFKEGRVPYKSQLSDFRYSLKDSENNYLSKEQVEFFKDSKVRDENGNLLVLYHGSKNNFTIFNKNRSGQASNVAKIGFWFTESAEGAKNFADSVWYGDDKDINVYSVYLNITKPKIYEGIIPDRNLETQLKTERTELVNERDRIENSYGYNEVGYSKMSAFGRLTDHRYNFDEAIEEFKNDFKDLSKSEQEKFISNATKVRGIETRINQIDDIIADKIMYTDSYEQFKTDVYKAGGFNAEYANAFGIGRALYKDGKFINLDTILEKYKNNLLKNGYDGIIIKNTAYDTQTLGENNTQYVVFDPNQIKLTTNQNPTISEDIRFSLKDGNGDYNFSKGQIAKYIAEHSKSKAYSKTDAEQVINTIVSNQLAFGEKYGEISNKTKQQVIDTLWHALNTKNEGYRTGVALEIADYIIDNAIAEDVYQSDNSSTDTFVIDVLKDYLHKIDLSGIRSEIKYRYDNDNSPYLIWGKRKGTQGQSPDQIAMELAEMGLHLDSTNEADIFFEIDNLYRKAIRNLKKATKQRLSDVLDNTSRNELRQAIAREVLMAYDTTGHKTRFAETIEKYTSKISSLKSTIREIKSNNRAKNNVISTIERLRDEFVKSKPAGWKVPQEVVNFVRKIAKVETWRNNISTTARQHLAELQNQLDSIMDETQQKIYPYRETLRELGSGDGELTTQELITLDNILRQFAWQLRNYDNVVFEGKSVSNTEIAIQGVHESKQAQRVLKSGDKLLVKFKNKVYANPFDRMAELGLYRNNSVMVRLYNDMLNGDRKRANFVRDANKLFDDFLNKNKNYLKELQQEITVHSNNEEIKITKRQALSLYLTSLREQGRSHLYNLTEDSGVIRLLDNKESTQGNTLRAFTKGKDINITRETISEIKQQLTSVDKEYLEIVDTFFNKMSKNAKRDTDTQLYGITNVEDDYYFPIKVSKDKIYTEAGQNNLDVNQYILNMGMNKSIKPNASNKIVIDGVDNIISKHINDMSLYYGFAIPLTAYNRIMNKQILVGDTDNTSNIRSEIQKIDSDFEGYMNRLWQDIQGIHRGDKGFISNVLSKIRWAGANAALGANPKVLMTQTLSLASALSEFNPKYIVKGLGHFFGEKNKLDLAKYSSLMYERMQIGNSVDVTEIRQIGKEIGNKFGNVVAKITKGLNTFTTKPISWMDSNVIQSLWFAAQYEIADTRGKGYEFGTEANKIEAGKRLDEAVFHTQQTSDPIGRSEWLRSDNEIVKFARMFTSDAIQLTGKMIASVNKYNITKRMIRSGDSELVRQGQEMLNSSKTAVVKASSAFVLNQVMLLAIALAFKWIKGKDDDEEWSDIAKNEAMANLVGLIPFGGDIYDKLSGYEPTNMAYTALSNTVEIVDTMFNEAVGLLKGEYTDPIARGSAFRKSILSVSRLLGIPAQNFESYFWGIMGKISPATREKYEALYKTKSISSYLDKIKKATENGDEQLADTSVNIVCNSRTRKIKDDNMLDVVSDLLGQGYDVLPRTVNSTITYDGVEYNLTNRQHKKFMEIYSQSNDIVKNMISLSAFNKLDDEAKAKAINFVYDYYYNLGIEDLLGEDIETKTMLFAEAIPITQLAMAVAQASIYTADTDRNGNIISGTKKAKIQAYVQRLRLSAVQKYMIMGYLGYSNKYGESSVRAYINRLDISAEAKDYLFEASGYAA